MARPRTAPNDDAQFQQPFERMENGGHTASQGQRPRRDSAVQSFDEAENDEGVSVSRRRQLYCGPMSWLMGACFFGPLVLLCPCDGREVYLADAVYDEDQGVPEAHVDDVFDQEGVLLKPLKSETSLVKMAVAVERETQAEERAADTGHNRRDERDLHGAAPH